MMNVEPGIKVIFKNLEKSELAKEAVIERMTAVMSKFPELSRRKITVTLSMDNSPTQAGPDLFRVKAQFRGGQYRGLIIEKSASSLYTALAALVDRIHERMNRHSHKERSVHRAKMRKHKKRLRTDSDFGLKSPA